MTDDLKPDATGFVQVPVDMIRSYRRQWTDMREERDEARAQLLVARQWARYWRLVAGNESVPAEIRDRFDALPWAKGRAA